MKSRRRKMSVIIKEYKNYNADEILSLHKDAGWISYTEKPEMLKEAYEKSFCVLGAYEEDKLIGIIRAVGDGASILYIQDIIVLKSYHRKGIGTKLIQNMLERFSHIYQKVLLTDNQERTIKFYQSLGFKMDCEIGCVAFVKV